MGKRKDFIKRLFILLFMTSVSITVISGSAINAHGLFGEVKASIDTEDKKADVFKNSGIKIIQAKKLKEYCLFNLWLIIIAMVTFRRYQNYFIPVPRGETMVALKVRMDC